MVCVVDLGSNAIRLLVATHDTSRGMVILHRDRVPLRIGSSVFTTGHVGNNIQRIIDAIHHFQKETEKLSQENGFKNIRWKAVATSAMRDAKDRDQVACAVKESTSIDLHLLSGHQEAILALRAVATAHPLHGPFAVADLGGGSLELIIGQDGQLLRSASFQLGAVRWHDAIRFNNRELLATIDHEQDRLKAFAKGHQAKTAIGLGGVFRSIHQVTRSSNLEMAWLRKWRDLIAPLSPQERVQHHHLPKDRADIIIPALDAMDLTLQAVQAKCWTVPEGVGGIADALALELLEQTENSLNENSLDQLD